MTVFEWIGHLVLLFKIQGGMNFACLFSGGHYFCLFVFRVFFRSSEKSNPGNPFPIGAVAEEDHKKTEYLRNNTIVIFNTAPVDIQ